MRTVLHRWFFAWEFEKEEKWLNDMAAKGKALVHTGFCTYEFEDCTPGEYIYRLELLDESLDSPESRQYIGFLEETGAEQIGSYIRWCYFRRKAELGAFDLFSDFDSRIRHLKRILWLLWVALPLLIGSGCLNIWYSGISMNVIGPLNFAAGILALIVMVLDVLGIIRVSTQQAKLKREREVSEN